MEPALNINGLLDFAIQVKRVHVWGVMSGQSCGAFPVKAEESKGWTADSPGLLPRACVEAECQILPLLSYSDNYGEAVNVFYFSSFKINKILDYFNTKYSRLRCFRLSRHIAQESVWCQQCRVFLMSSSEGCLTVWFAPSFPCCVASREFHFCLPYSFFHNVFFFGTCLTC